VTEANVAGVEGGPVQAGVVPEVAGDREVPTAVTGRHLPALDGLRGVAIVAVFAYHLGWGRGTYLGVDLFFVLSGFLITSLLLEERVGTGRIDLPKFWARRARRLLPALFLLLAAIGLYVVLVSRFGGSGSAALIDLGQLRDDALATLFYVANWHLIFAHQSYFAQFQQVSPLLQTWSLAIEEQFYLIWPLVLVVALRRLVPTWRRRILAITVIGTVASAALMAAMHAAGFSASVLYYGTDTRAFDILVGAALAVLTAALAQPGPRARAWLHALGPLAAAALAWFFVVAGTGSGGIGGAGVPTGWMFSGGFLVAALLAAVVIADIRLLEPGPLARVLSFGPLRWVGLISYSLYLWHWPVIVFMSPARTGISGGWLDVARIAVATALAAGSYYLVERPIRRHRFGRSLRFTIAPAMAVLVAAVILVTTDPAVVVPAAAAVPADRIAPAPIADAAGAHWPASEAAVHLPPHEVVSRTHKLRVLILGDSVMGTAEPAITRALEATGEVTVLQQAIAGWGLSTDTGWRAQFRQYSAVFRPNIVLAMWSWDNVWAQTHPAQYRSVLMHAIDELVTPGGSAAGFLVAQEPVPSLPLGVDTSSARAGMANNIAGMDDFNRLVFGLARAHPGKIMYFPMSPAVELHGKFSFWLPPARDPSAPKSSWVRVRMVDGAHLCQAGAVRYADAVLADFTALFHLDAARRGWWSGSWMDQSQYHTPPGACPNDHPPT